VSALVAALLATTPVPYEPLLRALVETDTTYATGSCTAAAALAADALRTAGFPSAGLLPFAPPDRPREGGLLAILPGADPALKPLLLVAHIDVVPADPASWEHPPFKLTRADGYLYGRGVADNKAVAAALVTLLAELAAERPARGVAIGLTCGEETPAAFNGARWLATEGRRHIDPWLVLVPTGGALLDAAGQAAAITVAVGEKLQQNFRLTARGTAAHASRPTGDNAIVTLAGALTRIAAHRFPLAPTPAARDQIAREARTAAPAEAATARAWLAKPSDATAEAVAAARPAWNALLRTTCAPTIVETGAQANTIAATATANINCRLLPSSAITEIEATLQRVVADPRVAVAPAPPLAEAAAAPPWPAGLLRVVAEAARVWPGVAVEPALLTGATDARHFNAAGVPAYGVTVLFFESDGSRVHAADERVRARWVDEGRAFLGRLVRGLTRPAAAAAVSE
jgi:acetylornithine deacetylase/succinyl-diaminopimelate desuccinylase-like protein